MVYFDISHCTKCMSSVFLNDDTAVAVVLVSKRLMMAIETITLGGGCFWCIESAFNQVEGVVSAFCGYSNGTATSVTYREVCSGTTGHAEVVQITFDDEVISRREILEIFFALHDPTQLNRQGNDVGTQYRGGIYYTSDAQKNDALVIINEMKQMGVYDDPIVTEVVPLANYHQAENYHQDYFNNNPSNAYCTMVVAPKLSKFNGYFFFPYCVF